LVLQELKIHPEEIPALKNHLQGWTAIFSLPGQKKPIVVEFGSDHNRTVKFLDPPFTCISYPCFSVEAGERHAHAKAGVAILIKNSSAIQWEENSHIICDKFGRFVQAQISTSNGKKYSIGNMHGHNNPTQRGDQFTAIKAAMQGLCNPILLGDMNSVINPIMDSSHPHASVNTGKANETARTKELSVMAMLGLIDAFRQSHPDTKTFSRVHPVSRSAEDPGHLSARRIDRIYIAEELEDELVLAEYIEEGISDHQACQMQLLFNSGIQDSSKLQFPRMKNNILEKQDLEHIKCQMAKILTSTDPLELQYTKIVELIQMKYKKKSKKPQKADFWWEQHRKMTCLQQQLLGLQSNPEALKLWLQMSQLQGSVPQET